MSVSGRLMGLFYRALHHPWPYQILQTALGSFRLREICVELLAPKPGEKILDVGCGPGILLAYLPDIEYIGFDTNPNYIDFARRKFGHRAKFICDEFSKAYAQEMPRVDAILLMGLLHHIDDTTAYELMQVIHAALAPGGRVITLDPCFMKGQSRISRLVAEMDRGEFVRDEAGYQRIVGDWFGHIDTRAFANVCRIPSQELIMILREPKDTIQSDEHTTPESLQ